jgi:hypothetical protein
MKTIEGGDGIMDFIWYFLGGLVISGIMSALVRAPGAVLNQKFASLGDMQGKSLQEIVREVGPYSSISAMTDGGKLVQWMATGYHVALLFDERDVCKGISHEAKA